MNDGGQDFSQIPEYPWVRTGKAAEMADVCHKTIHNWLRKYPGLAYRAGGQWRVKLVALRMLVPLKEPADDKHQSS